MLQTCQGRNSTIRLLGFEDDSLVGAVLDLPRTIARMEQRRNQQEKVVQQHRLTGADFKDDGSDLPPDITPAPNVKVHKGEFPFTLKAWTFVSKMCRKAMPWQ